MIYDFIRLNIIILLITFICIFISLFLQRYKIIKIQEITPSCLLSFVGNIVFSIILSTILFVIFMYFDILDSNLRIYLLSTIIFMLEISEIRARFINVFWGIYVFLSKKIVNFIKIINKQIFLSTYFLNYNAENITFKQILLVFIVLLIPIDIFNVLPMLLIKNISFLNVFIIIISLNIVSAILMYINYSIKKKIVVVFLALLLPFSRVLILFGLSIISFSFENLMPTFIYISISVLAIWISPYLFNLKKRKHILVKLSKLSSNYSVIFFLITTLISQVIFFLKRQEMFNLQFLNFGYLLANVLIIFGLYIYLLISYVISIRLFEMNQEKKGIK